ncbi:hypothetical protein GLOTRDRAFT_140838 [Gloeophyllum trabeum ATCC 11539]|uniref:PH domain-containing protein n=1 Tax=Gloeophyllum trabeum (strain ATCC 11539 / FP-39264 / Madison 617) TaxID=670483 RepID=S7RH50_GLOTA|nr:uncharacterized protein GLOTRDRAFT_140838 [Gloeophyllum trabeum ATCC 11539]EPQ51904.1 hypothetical protein GLOTRDRAFT_140838 [Gloeophyllum trabeum ATCC 11539]
MTSYTTTDPSTGGPRSPLFGTATFSTLSPSDPSRMGYTGTSRTGTPIPPSDDGEDASTTYNMRRVNLSPTQSYTNTYTYSDDDSIDDTAEVEAALTNIENELADVEDALTEWSRDSGSDASRPTYSTLSGSGSYTTSSAPYTTSTGTGPMSTTTTTTTANMLAERNRLSTITERTEDRTNSRPNSGLPGSRPISGHSDALRRSAVLGGGAVSPSPHARSATESTALPPPGRRAGDLIAFFEGGASESPSRGGHTRTTSAPAGPRSPSPYFASTTGFGYSSGTGFGYSTAGYTSRPSSPAASKSGSSVSGTTPFTMSSFLSPQARGTTSLSSDSRFPTTTTARTGTTTPTQTGTGTYTQTGTGTYANTYSTFSSTLTPTTNTNTFTGTPTASSLRRPQTSPRSPLTSVRNIVAAWKERTPLGSKTAKSPASASSVGTVRSPPGEGLFSIRRRAERGQMRLRDQALGSLRRGEAPSFEAMRPAEEPRSTSDSVTGSALLPPPFDIAELGVYARGSQEPLRIGLLWYLNVHAPPPYRWQRCQALLYPHMLLLSWIAAGGGRGVVTLDLLNCTEVRSVPTPLHPSAKDDVGTIAARMQSEEASSQESGQLGEMGLVETLCPFQLLYSDGIERLGAESARERVRWVSAIWEALDRSVTIPDRSATGSPTGSIRTIRSMTSTNTESATGSGSASTVFVPPLDSIPDLSDLQSITGSSTSVPLSRGPSFAVSTRTRATDDAAVSGQGFLYPGDPRVIAPSRSSSIRRTSSLTDLDAEFASAVSRARNARPGLGFGLGLAAGVVLGEGSPVTISSAPRLGEDVRLTPPPKSRSRGTSSRTSSELDDETFFSAGSKSASDDTKGSSFYSSLSRTDFTTTGAGITTTDTTVGLAITSGSDTNIVASSLSLRGPSSASHLGDSHDGTPSTYTYGSTSPSRLSRAREVRRRSARSSSRTFSSSYQTRTTDEGSDKENSEISGSTPSRSTEYDTSSRGYTATTTSCSCSYSGTCSTCRYTSSSGTYTYTDDVSEVAPSVIPSIPSESEYITAEAASTEYSTAEAASTEYSTAEVCSTEYSTAEVCPTPSVSEYITADVCKSEPPSEYITAEVCPTELTTEYDTAECRCIPSIAEEEDEERSVVAPSEIPTIPSDVEPEICPEDIPLPPSEPASVSSPSWPPTEPSLTDVSESQLEPTEDFTPTTVSTIESFPGPSPIQPMESLPSSETPESISSPTESSITPTIEELTPTVSSEDLQQPTPPSPSIRESLWAPESDRSYESSILQASPSVLSIAVPEGPDMSYETSGLRPSGSPITTEQPRLSPIPELPSTVTPSSPTSVTATPESVSTPTDVPTPSLLSAERTVTVTRTPSSVSTVSSISMRSSIFEPRSLFEFQMDEEPTEPSLLSTHRSPPTPVPVDQRSLSPAFIPLPSSPAPSTPSVPISVSIATPAGDVPSIHTIESAPSARSEILTHDVNRLLQYLHDLDQGRVEDHRELVDNIRDIRDELYDLSLFLHENRPADVPPPVPHKDQSVGGSSVIASSPATPMTPRALPAGPRPISRPHLIPIPLTPPPLRPASPSSLTSSISFLESPHSDDWSLMGSETYPMRASSPSWPSESSPSPPSSPLEASSESISSSTPSSGPYLSATSPSSPSAPASPPLSATSDVTARPRPPPISLTDLLENLEALKQQTNALHDSQRSANDMLGELRDRGPATQDLSACCDKIQRIEDMLRGVLDRLQVPQPESLYESPSETSSDRERLQRILDRIGGHEEPPVIRMPVPVRAGPSLDEQLENLLGSGPQMPPPTVQAPPPLIPFVYRPAPHRPRSESPTIGPDLPPRRSYTAPAPDLYTVRRPPRRSGGRPGRPPFYPPPRTASSFRDQGREPPVIPSLPPEEGPVEGSRRPEGESGPDFLRALRELRRRRHPDTAPDGFFNTGRAGAAETDAAQRPPTAPPDLGEGGTWYRPAQPPTEPQPGAEQAPGTFIPPGAGFPISVLPPGVAMPPHLQDILEMLRENRVAQRASIEQQREIMRYLRGLNEWLARDVHDRQAEIRGVAARVDRLRDDLDRMGRPQTAGVQPMFTQGPPPQQGMMPGPGMPVPQQTGDTYVIPPLPTMGQQGPVMPNVVPGYPGPMPGPGMPQGPIVNVLPGSPSDGSPVIPPPQPYEQYDDRPVVPSGPYTPGRPPTGYYPDEGRSYGSESPVFIPPEQPQQQPGQPIVIPPPGAFGGVPQQQPQQPIVIQSAPQQQPPTVIHVERSPSESETRSGRGSPIEYDVPLSHRPSHYRPESPQQVHLVSDRPGSPRMGSPRHPEVQQPIIIQQPPQQMQQQPMQPIVVQPTPSGGQYTQHSPPIVVRRSRTPSPERQQPTMIITPSGQQVEHGPGQPIAVVPTPQPQQPPVIVQTGAPTSPYHEYGPSRGEYSPSRGDRRRRGSYSPSRQYGDRGESPSPPSRRRHRRDYDEEDEPGRTIILEPRGRGRTRFVDRHGRSRSPRPSDHVVAVVPHGGHGRSYSRSHPRDEGDYGSRSGSRTPPRVVIASDHGGSPRAPTIILPPGGSGGHYPSEHDPGRTHSPNVLRRQRHPTEYDPGHGGPQIVRIPPSDESMPRSPGDERDPGGLQPSHYGRSPSRGHDYAEEPDYPEPHQVPPPRTPRTPSRAPSAPLSRAGTRRTAPVQRTPSGATIMEPYEEEGEPHMTRATHIPVEEYEPPPASPPPGVVRSVTPRTELHHELMRQPSTAPMFPTLPAEGREAEVRRAPSRRTGYQPSVVPEEAPLMHEEAGLGRAPSRRTGYQPSVVPEEAPMHEEAGLGRMPSRRTGYQPSVMGDQPTIVRIPGDTHEVSEHEEMMYADAERARQERFEDLQRRLEQTAEVAAQDEERRDQEFRQREEERDHMFADNEARRDEEAARRRDEIWSDLEQRLAAGGLPPPPPPPESIEPAPESVPPIPIPERLGDETASIIPSMIEAANQHAREIREVVNMEREELIKEREAHEAERERMRQEAEAEREAWQQECEQRIRELEEELARTRAELDDERQQRQTEEAEARERARQEALERDEIVRGQLSDITNLAQQNLECCTSKRQIMDERYAEKEARRAEKDARFQDLYDMVNRIVEDREAERQRAEEERLAAADKPGIEAVMAELQRQNQELRQLLAEMADSWRADSARQAEETLNAVRATAQEQVPFNVQGYLDEFSKALASEVRMLLGEVGRLREERRALQHEIGFLLCTRSKYGPGGEFDPEWRPQDAPYMAGAPPPPPAPEPAPEAPPPPPEPMGPARPGWRTVLPRSTRRRRGGGGQPTPAPPAEPEEMPRPGVSSWATWQPDPAFAPSPSMPPAPEMLAPPEPQGLFGPRSPRDSYRG